ncbi:MAG: helix-turn-helix transcriptional regulator [Candidatus Moraniibacteriota bacterium]
MNTSQKIKNTIKIERKKRRITQTEFANALEVSRQTVAILEKGDYSPSLFLAIKISRYFHEPIENLFFLK